MYIESLKSWKTRRKLKKLRETVAGNLFIGTNDQDEYRRWKQFEESLEGKYSFVKPILVKRPEHLIGTNMVGFLYNPKRGMVEPFRLLADIECRMFNRFLTNHLSIEVRS